MRRKKHYFETRPGDPEPLRVTIARTVHFSEVDALAIAWHGRYLEFFEEAHTELMRRAGLTYQQYRQYDLGAPMVQSHVDYFRPLELDERFTVEASLVWCDGARLNVEYRIDKADGTPAATGFTVQMFVDWRSREPYMVEPEIFLECKRRWREGVL
ncbi:1,4-dihydroxy-2-naphthoyl-CoA hydrolase [bioreactor metagenome]|uniref:1,4-dihydroxy-2-naphthoyl-CoA hydrolase n=1 Tax=bioreactor metagenome TaxID=1076179 RepID=A0A645H6Z3_9ZZZZ